MVFSTQESLQKSRDFAPKLMKLNDEVLFDDDVNTSVPSG